VSSPSCASGAGGASSPGHASRVHGVLGHHVCHGPTSLIRVAIDLLRTYGARTSPLLTMWRTGRLRTFRGWVAHEPTRPVARLRTAFLRGRGRSMLSERSPSMFTARRGCRTRVSPTPFLHHGAGARCGARRHDGRADARTQRSSDRLPYGYGGRGQRTLFLSLTSCARRDCGGHHRSQGHCPAW
jgi:hypothetical protein